MITPADRGRLRRRLARRDSDKKKIAGEVIEKPELLEEILDGLGAEEAAVKYASAKVIRAIGEREPSVLYPRADLFIDLLGSENTILRWEAILALASLARVDSERKMDAVLDRYLEPIRGPVMITAANTIKGAARIALARPELTARIVKAILAVEKARYGTPECRNIAIGHALEALGGELFDQAADTRPILSFARRHLENPRSSTRRKAERLVKKRG